MGSTVLNYPAFSIKLKITKHLQIPKINHLGNSPSVLYVLGEAFIHSYKYGIKHGDKYAVSGISYL